MKNSIVFHFLNICWIVMAVKACPENCQCFEKVVHCASKDLKVFPTNLPEEIIQLFVENNSISSLQPLKQMNNSQLHTITLQNNRISCLLPCAFCGVSSLKYLNLKNNSLTTISKDTFANLRLLTLLSLAKNEISTLSPLAFVDIVSVLDLFLSENLLSYLSPGVFSSLSKLSTLRLDHNAIRSIPNRLFVSLNALTYLDLSYNRLQRITTETFKGLKSLNNLFLQNNKIHNLDPQFILPDQHCSELNGESTEQKLESTDSGCFANLREVRKIDLSNNDLTSIRYSTFLSLSQLEFIGLSGNHWRCDCFLVWSLMRFNSNRGNNRLATSHMACWEPKKLRGFSVENLSVEDSSYDDQFFPNKNENPSVIMKPTPEPLFFAMSEKDAFNSNLQQSLTTQSTLFDKDIATKFLNDHTNGKTKEHNLDLQTESDKIKRNSDLGMTSSTLPLKPSTYDDLAPDRSQIKKTFPGRSQSLLVLDSNASSANENEMSIDNTKNIQGKNYEILDADLTSLQKGIHHRHEFPSHVSTTKINVSDHNGVITIAATKKEDSDSKNGQIGLMSWLVAAAIIAALFAAGVCGVAVVNKQFDHNGIYCCCCRRRNESTRQQGSESIRSFSNYPLLYDNPLARRPLPEQPIHYSGDQSRSNQPIRANNNNEQVDIQWTCGGTFGIGDVNPPGSRLIRSPARNFRRGSAEGYPPIIPPRLPKNMPHWSSDNDQNARQQSFDPSLLSTSAQNLSRSSSKQLPIPSKESINFSDLQNGTKRGFVISPHHSDQQQDDYRVRHDRQQHRKGPESAIGIEKNAKSGEFDLMPPTFVQEDFNRQSTSAPITRQCSFDAPHQISRKIKREHIMIQMLEALEEIDTSRRNSNATESNKPNKSIGSHNQHELHSRVMEKCFPQTKRKSGDKRIGNFTTDNQFKEHDDGNNNGIRNTVKGRISHNPLPESKKINSHVCEKCNHVSYISDVDFEFPPPPPCIAISCSEDSQAYSSSMSEASYDIDLPPPPSNMYPAERRSFYNDPTTTHCASNLTTQNSSSDAQNSYSVLALCSSGKDYLGPASKQHPLVVRESDYKIKSETSSKNTDWRYGRKDSTDSMFVSINSTCNSLPPSDFEDDICEGIFDIVSDAVAQSENLVCKANVKYRNRRKESLTNRRKELEEEYRKSMPIYNKLLLKAANLSDSEEQHLLGNSKSLLKSDRCLYRSMRPIANIDAENELQNHRLSRLELSFSESELDENSLHRSPSKNKHRCYISRRRTSSASSLTTVTTASESPGIKNSAHSNKVSNKSQRLLEDRKVSMSSFGSESVSSIEFGAATTNAHSLTRYKYQVLDQTYSEKEQFSKKAIAQTESKSNHSNKIKHHHASRNSKDNTSADSTKKRCYFDVIESSADDVSTDIEMVNLGTM